MSFMQPGITPEIPWFEIDGTHGITFLPANDFPELYEELDEEGDLIPESFADYYEGIPQDVHIRKGFGARLSAPGYMDQTEWSVFDTPEEAKAFLDDNYGDDDEESED